ATTAGVDSISRATTPPTAPSTIEPDGTLDFSFNPGNFTNGQILASVLQPDGKLLIGGEFRKVHDVFCLGLARLNADGTRDQSFAPPAGFQFDAEKIYLQSDGKIIVISTTAVSGNLTRLNSDGSLDSTFHPNRV